MAGKMRLSKLKIDEISLVPSGDNHGAVMVLSKAVKECTCNTFTGTDNGKCERCGGSLQVLKSMSKDSIGYNARRTALQSAYNKMHGKSAYIDDFGDDWLVVNTYSDVVGSMQYIKLSYAVLDGAITFGEPVEVEQRTYYAMIGKAMPDGGSMMLDTHKFIPTPKGDKCKICGKGKSMHGKAGMSDSAVLGKEFKHQELIKIPHKRGYVWIPTYHDQLGHVIQNHWRKISKPPKVKGNIDTKWSSPRIGTVRATNILGRTNAPTWLPNDVRIGANVDRLRKSSIHIKKKKHNEAWLMTHPSPLSSPRDIVGHGLKGHHPHGPSIRWPALYEDLKAKGKSKRVAAMISNGLWAKRHGLRPQKSLPRAAAKVKRRLS